MSAGSTAADREQLAGAELLEHLALTLTTVSNWYTEQAELEHSMEAVRRGWAVKAAVSMGADLAEGPPLLVALGAGEVDGIAFVWPLAVER